ncbi:hypothetical protein FHX06_006340 [Rhizobium sp. BK512]|uniref:peptidoglycan-binding protein n=1 Tax=Rhizobium sp. BK512 TaxID=2587010 RepID=UPI001618011F|nr:peptidoglycan-binding protein [Rhizobium sp. BK512]MBB3564970.1 hypothetical protein [Rhizobium sp. BK512]
MTLERGAQGNDVLIVQRAVGVSTDGKFGAATEAAVRQYQLNHGLRSDGVVGPRTWSTLLQDNEPKPVAAALIPEPGRKILDLIASVEAPAGYGTKYGNNQNKLDKALTAMTLDEVMAAGPTWSAQYGSSACGRYQFMSSTLKELRMAEKLDGSELFSESLQDRLGYALLEKRGYEKFMTGKAFMADFGKALAREWAAFPVLENCQGQHRLVERGETYYAGDKRNKALLTRRRWRSS